MRTNKVNFNLLVFVLSFFFISTANTQDLAPPQNLTCSIEGLNDAILSWDQPSTTDSILLHWDGEHTNNYYGFFIDGYREYSCAAKWNPEHLTEYDNWKITSVKFVLQQMSFMELKLKIWEGPNKVEVYSQDITEFNNKDWTELQLDTPFDVDASKDLLVGIYIKTYAAGTPIGIDTSQLVVGQGFWMHYNLNGNWHWYEGSDPLLNVHNNMNVRVHVEPVKEKGEEEKKKELLGYNVYKNGEKITPSPISSTSYVDMNLNNGIYNYYVTAVYGQGESDSSNIVSVHINQPVILEQDSLALVDLYNNCGGEDWFYNGLWLQGPVNEWDGVYTDGNRVTGLWLSANGVVGDVPESIGNLDALRFLYLEGNYGLESIPETIGNIDSLRNLWLSYTLINEIPESIGNLSELKQLILTSLDLSGNNLPESISNLKKLETLGVSSTNITALPSELGNIDSLRNLYASNNFITLLPENFGNLGNLEYLLLSENQIEELPENFGNLSKLRYFYIDQNNLESLPENFGNLEKLYIFNGSMNSLTGLPDSFGNLSNLSVLWMVYNNLEELPASFGNLSSLDSLRMDNNFLQGLPENFGNLDDMSYCIINKNEIQSLPESICDLETIEILVMNVNNITELPSDIGNLSTLKNMQFAVNQISELPESIVNLDSLKILNLNQNNLQEIPENIDNMSSLENLGISVNELTHLPEALGNLNLYALTFNINNIKEIPQSILNNNYEYLYIYDNFLQFGSIEPLMNNVSVDFQYAPQKKIGNDTTIVLEQGSEFDYTVEVSGTHNEYQWYKNGIAMVGFNTNTLHFDNLTPSNEGTYVLKVNNTMVPDLELSSSDIVLSVTVGVKENISGIEFSVYPNPVKQGKLYLKLPENNKINDISIYNVNGKQVKRVEILNKTIDVSDLTEGIYLLTVNLSNGKSLTEKFVIN